MHAQQRPSTPAVESKKAFVVDDALQNNLVKENPLVLQEDVRCYAGITLRSAQGQILGTLCVLDGSARHFEPDDLVI